MGAVLLISVVSLATFSVNKSTKDVETGSRNLGDRNVKIENDGSDGSYIINFLDVNPDDISMLVGETKRVTATVQPANIWNIAINWATTSADSEIIELPDNINEQQFIDITGKKEGKALLTAKTTDGSNLSKDVIVRVGVKGEGVNITGPLNVKSTEAITLQVNFDNSDVTWNNKDIKWTIKENTDVVSIQGDTISRKLILVPRTGDTSVKVHCLVKDLVFDVTSEAEFTVNISQVWSEWSTSPSNKPGEQMKQQYRGLTYNEVTKEYSDAQNVVGETRLQNGNYITYLKGYEQPLAHDPNPNNPLIKRRQYYKELKWNGSYTEWTENKQNVIFGTDEDTKTQYSFIQKTTKTETYNMGTVTHGECIKWTQADSLGPGRCRSICPGGYSKHSIGGHCGGTSSAPLSYLRCENCKGTRNVTICGSSYSNWSDSSSGDTGCGKKTRTMYRYKVYEKIDDAPRECINNICPEDSSTSRIEKFIMYRNPIFSQYSDWSFEVLNNIEPNGQNSGQFVQKRNMYRYPINAA